MAMNPRAWGTAARDALRSLVTSPLMSLASTATVAVSLLVLSVVVLVAVNLQFMASTVEQQVEVKAYLCSTQVPSTRCPQQALTDAQKTEIVAKAKKVSGVKAVKYVSADEALQQMKKQFGEQADILDDLGVNPLRDALEIQLIDTNNVKTVADSVLQISGVSDVNYGQDYVEKLLAVTTAVRIGGAGLVLMLLIATVLTISNTIRLAVYARRREISIMKLVGATDWYIRRPFMMEGIFLGVFGAILAMFLTSLGYGKIVGYVHENIPFLPLVSANVVLSEMTIALVVLGGALGAVGSVVSMRRFLKV